MDARGDGKVSPWVPCLFKQWNVEPGPSTFHFRLELSPSLRSCCEQAKRPGPAPMLGGQSMGAGVMIGTSGG